MELPSGSWHAIAADAPGRSPATSRPLHVGGTTVVVETTLADDDGRPVARTTQTQAVLMPREGV